MNLNKNVERKDGYDQVCVWPACIVYHDDEENKETKISDFEDLMKKHFNADVQFLEQIYTYPDKDENGNEIPDTGERCDLFFAVHKDSVMSFAIPRLAYGIRWLEDVLSPENYASKIYPQRIFEYQTW